MKKIYFILILFSINVSYAQYFDINNSIEKSIHFKNSKFNTSYKLFLEGAKDLNTTLSNMSYLGIDSLKPDNDKPNYFLLKSISAIESNKLKEALASIIQSKKLSLQNNYELGINHSNLVLSIINYKLNAIKKSIDFLMECAYQAPILKFQVEYLKAQYYYDLQSYNQTIEILLTNEFNAKSISEYDYLKTLSLLVLCTSQNDDDALAISYALKYDSLLNKAIEFRSLEKLMNENVKYIKDKSDNFSSIFLLQKITNCNNIGFLYRRLGDYKSSKIYLLKSIDYLMRYKNENLLPEIKTNIGLTYTHLKDFTEANTNYQDALKLYTKLKNSRKIAELNNIIAKNYFLEGKPLLAIQSCETAVSISQPNKDYRNLANAYFILSEVYAVNSDYMKSQNYFKLFTETKNLTQQQITEENEKRNVDETNANNLISTTEEEISNREKKELELIRIKLESKQKEQELLLIKKDNEIKQKALVTQALEKDQALQSLALLSGQLEKEKLMKEYDRVNKEKEIKALENEKSKGQIKLLNSLRLIDIKNNNLKNLELASNKKKEQYLFIGLLVLSTFIGLLGFGFYTNIKQKKIIQASNVQLKIIGENLQSSNIKLEDSLSEINEQKIIIEGKNNLVMDSISYSSKIQRSLLLKGHQLDDFFISSFVIDMPRDIVGGDFYYIKTKGDKLYVAMADCTGHGVPGSLISIIGYQEINHIINNYYLTPAGILKKLNENISRLVNNEKNDLGSDGMDVMLLEIDKTEKKMTFAGARSYLLIHGNKEFNEYKGDRLSIGEIPDEGFEFSETIIPITEHDTIFMYTDGFQDQNIETTRKRLGSRILKQTIQENIDEDLVIQKDKLLTLYQNQKGSSKQTDDITILAFKPNLKIENNFSMAENPKIREVLNKISIKESSVNNLIIVYGKITQEIILSTVKLIERKLNPDQYSKGFITKVKMLSTEIMQNINKHQEVSIEIEPYFILNADENGLYLYSGNLIDSESKTYLNEKLTKYKILSKDELKSVYTDTFLNSSLNTEGNAGLGLLTIVSKSEQNYKYDLTQVTDNLFHFSIEVFLKAISNKVLAN